ncbi:MAG: tyrosine-type recombinase/integrase [Candidatus Limnocylindrales bacterium]
MNELRRAIDEYLAIRRALGFKLRGHDRLLWDFTDFLAGAGATTITAELALRWATAPVGMQPVRWGQRLAAVRGFARHLHALDASVEVPPVELLSYRRERSVPYLYSEADITALLAAAGTLHPALRAATHETLFGLLAVTGMRVGEAIHLERTDVDLHAGVLLIAEAKFRKSRRLPLHASTVAALSSYAERRDALCRRPRATSFFVSTRGTRLLDTCVHAVFTALVARVGLVARPGTSRPLIHGLRHSFALATLRDWYAAGGDIAGKLPVLSAYLGHAHPASTYWYLQAAPELLALAAERLEHFGSEPR